MVAACAVLSGCAGGDVEDGEPDFPSTSQVITETQANPWDLPIEDRPELFDPCVEIPLEAVSNGAGSQVEEDPGLAIREPGNLISCGWKNDEIIFNVVATWKSRDSFLSDDSFTISKLDVGSRPGYLVLNKSDVAGRSCQQLFFTSLGAVFLSVDLVHGLSSFRGKNFADPCAVLTEASEPIMQHIPEGDF